jgi:hypothetical protein
MASFLDSAALAIADAAGWKRPQADDEGAYTFSVQGGLDMRLFSPDGGNTLIFCATVQDLPEEEKAREDLLLVQSQRAVGVAKERKTILALNEDTLLLQRVLPSRETRLEDMSAIAEAFFNDLAWWRAQVARG